MTTRPGPQDRRYLQTTCSVCPTCSRLVPAQVFATGGRVFMRKFCPDHGHVEVLIASDETWYVRTSAIHFQPERPLARTAAVRNGCPFDCGICPDHQQRCMIPVVEITDRCEMECPICFANNRQTYVMTPEEMDRCLDVVVRAAGTAVDSLVISGGEPTGHPRFFDLVTRARRRGFRHVTVNTNGLRLAADREFVWRAAEMNLEFTLWIDGFTERTHRLLRGRDTRPHKERALAHLGEAGVPTTLLCVVARGINEHEVGAVLDLGIRLPFVRGIVYHTLAFCGKGGTTFPHDPLDVITLPDIMRLLAEQTGGRLARDDFSPIPAPHPLCESSAYLLLTDDGQFPLPLSRIVPRGRYRELVENRAILRPDERLEGHMREVIDHLYAIEPPTPEATRALGRFKDLLGRCFPADRPISSRERESLCERAFKAVVLIPYMDRFNLDLTRLRGCVSMQALPDGRLIPTCSYYPLHRASDPRFSPEARAAPTGDAGATRSVEDDEPGPRVGEMT